MLLSAIAPRADAIALPTEAVALDRRPVTARVPEWAVPDPRNILSDRAVRVGDCPTSQILEGRMMFSRVAFWVSLPTVTLWRRQLFVPDCSQRSTRPARCRHLFEFRPGGVN